MGTSPPVAPESRIEPQAWPGALLRAKPGADVALWRALLFLRRECSLACCLRDGVLGGTAAFACFFLKCESERRS
jgi:hypothetical protein